MIEVAALIFAFAAIGLGLTRLDPRDRLGRATLTIAPIWILLMAVAGLGYLVGDVGEVKGLLQRAAQLLFGAWLVCWPSTPPGRPGAGCPTPDRVPEANPDLRPNGGPMLIAAVIALCILLAVLGFLLPRLSNHARRGSDKGFSLGQRAGGKAPGPIGRLLSKSFGKSRSAADKSHSAGQKARSKAPF